MGKVYLFLVFFILNILLIMSLSNVLSVSDKLNITIWFLRSNNNLKTGNS